MSLDTSGRYTQTFDERSRDNEVAVRKCLVRHHSTATQQVPASYKQWSCGGGGGGGGGGARVVVLCVTKSGDGYGGGGFVCVLR